MNLLLALAPSLAFGSLGLIFGAWPASFRRQSFAVTLSAGIASLLLAAIMGSQWSVTALIAGIVSGLLWTVGQSFMLLGIKTWGVSRTVPFNTAIQLFLNVMLGILIFGEWNAAVALLLGFLGLGFVILGAVGCSWQEQVADAQSKAARRIGILSAVASALAFGVYPAGLRLAGVSSADAVGPMGIGLLLGSVLVAAFFPREEALVGRHSLQTALAGCVWAVGNAVMLYSTVSVGVAVGFSLSQLGFVVSTLGGIFLLHENKTRLELRATLSGVGAAVVGVILLGLASTF